MRALLTACLGIFSVMALSNAIVPVLPSYAEGSALQGAIYSAYFFGAFLLTIPSGLLSEKYGRTTLIQLGLVITVASGIFLLLASDPFLVTGIRFLEGAGAGLFVAASMTLINARTDHATTSGYLMAALNAGLVLGLIAGGFLAPCSQIPSLSVLLFTGICCIPALLSIRLYDPFLPEAKADTKTLLTELVYDYRWLWYSVIILLGTTGVVTSLFPELSDAKTDVAGAWISVMSIATIIAVLAISRINLPPVPTIRATSLLMAGGVLISFYSAAGFIIIGAAAGIAMIAQMAFLAHATRHQGVAMGLFSATSYLGMSLLSFLAGILAENTTFFIAFAATAIMAASVSVIIGRCPCRDDNRTKLHPAFLE
jgi:MFS family permease